MSKEKTLIKKAKEISNLVNELEELIYQRDALKIDNYTVCLAPSLYLDNKVSVISLNFCKEAILKSFEDQITLLGIKLEELMINEFIQEEK